MHRPLALAVLLTAASVAAPAAAGAQRAYTLAGCDSRELPGYAPGVKLCASGVFRITDTDPLNPDRAELRFNNVQVEGFASFAFSTVNGLPSALPVAYRFSPNTGASLGDLADATPVFCLLSVCRGPTLAGGVVYSFGGNVGYVPETVTLTVDFYAPEVAGGTSLITGEPPAPVLRRAAVVLNVVPEPTTLALGGAGVVLLGAWARRRSSSRRRA